MIGYSHEYEVVLGEGITGGLVFLMAAAASLAFLPTLANSVTKQVDFFGKGQKWTSYSLSPGGGGGCPAGVLHHGLPPLRPLHPSHAGRPPRHLLHPLRACLPNVQPLLRPTGLWTHSWPCLPNPPNSHLSGPSVLYNAQPGWPNGKEQGGTRSKSCSNKKCQ